MLLIGCGKPQISTVAIIVPYVYYHIYQDLMASRVRRRRVKEVSAGPWQDLHIISLLKTIGWNIYSDKLDLVTLSKAKNEQDIHDFLRHLNLTHHPHPPVRPKPYLYHLTLL